MKTMTKALMLEFSDALKALNSLNCFLTLYLLWQSILHHPEARILS